jgi:hypothetical protein
MELEKVVHELTLDYQNDNAEVLMLIALVCLCYRVIGKRRNMTGV